MPSRVSSWLTPAAWVAAVSAVLLLVFPVGFPNYDTIYALVWGRELAHGVSPDVGSALPPTPHPLTELLGLVTTPLGNGAITVTMVLAYASLGLIGFFVYRLGAIWFDRWIGAVAAAIVLTRAPFLSNGLRAYIDLPYIALCLAALLVEAKRPRAGWPVLALLALAGLLRPEAWLFAGAYWLYLALDWRSMGRKVDPGSTYRPIGGGWGGVGSARAGSSLGSGCSPSPARCSGCCSTRSRPATRSTRGPAPKKRSRRWSARPGRSTSSSTGRGGSARCCSGRGWSAPSAASCLAWPSCAAARLSASSPPDSPCSPSRSSPAAASRSCPATRCSPPRSWRSSSALALLGWRLLEPGHRWRRAWQLFAALIALMFLAWLPNQWDLDSRVDTDLTNQARIEGDLSDLVDDGAFEPLCGPIAVPNHRAVPRLAFGLDIRPTADRQRQRQ